MTPFVIVTLIVAVACLLLLLVPWRTASKPPSNRGKPLDTLTSSHARPASVGPPAPQPPKSEDAVLPNNRTPRLLTPQGHVAANTTSTVLDATPPAAVMSAVPSKPLSTGLVQWYGGSFWSRAEGRDALEGAQPVSSHCLPNAKCQLQWHL